MKQPANNAQQIALNYFNAWTTHQFDTAAALLADNVTFQMPINAYASKRAFMDAVQFTATASTGVEPLAQFGGDGEALLLYELTLPGIGKLRIAEYFKVDNEKITAIWHVHDTAALVASRFDQDTEK